jgi:hypothetical protein
LEFLVSQPGGTGVAFARGRIITRKFKNIKKTMDIIVKPAAVAISEEKNFTTLLESATRNKGYSTIPRTLFKCIIFFARVLPGRSAPTFIELWLGAMLTQSVYGEARHSLC